MFFNQQMKMRHTNWGWQSMSVAILLLIFIFFNKGYIAYGQNNTKEEVKKLKSKLEDSKGESRARIFLSLCTLYLTFSADSSFYYADEALRLSKVFKNDTLTGRSYMSIGFLHMMTGKDSFSISAFNKATETFSKISDSVNLAWNYVLIGQFYYYKNDYNKALKYYSRSLQIYLGMNDPQHYSRMITVLNEISYVYSDQKDYKHALFYLFRALEIAEAIDDNGLGKSSVFSGIGNIYFDWKQYKKAQEYFIKSYEINKKIGDNKALAYSLNDLGKVYFETGKYETAFQYHKMAEELFLEINDNIGISSSATNIGKYYRVKKKYDIALKYFQSALSNCKQNKQQSLVATLFYEIGNAYYNMNMPAKALDNSIRSLEIAQSIPYQEYIYKNYLLISDIYAATASCTDAFQYYRLYVAKKDSIYNADIYRQMSESEDRYKSYLNQKEIKILKQREEIQNIDMRRQKIFRNSSFLVTMLFAALVFVALRSNRQKRRANLIIAAEKDRSDKLLMNILPEETAEELKINGFAKTRYYEHVSVLFTDFKGFTGLSQQMTPEQLVAELDYCFKAYDAIIEKHHVEKIKTIGDSYMCAGGLPVSNTTNPVDVVKCGIEICAFMQEYKQKRMALDMPYFEVRIGVHTGPVISGIVGTKKFAYDIWGDTVNTASRMESSGVVGVVNISGETYQYIKHDFNCAYRGKVEAKNKGMIDMYLVKGCKDEV